MARGISIKVFARDERDVKGFKHIDTSTTNILMWMDLKQKQNKLLQHLINIVIRKTFPYSQMWIKLLIINYNCNIVIQKWNEKNLAFLADFIEAQEYSR